MREIWHFKNHITYMYTKSKNTHLCIWSWGKYVLKFHLEWFSCCLTRVIKLWSKVCQPHHYWRFERDNSLLVLEWGVCGVLLSCFPQCRMFSLLHRSWPVSLDASSTPPCSYLWQVTVSPDSARCFLGVTIALGWGLLFRNNAIYEKELLITAWLVEGKTVVLKSGCSHR